MLSQKSKGAVELSIRKITREAFLLLWLLIFLAPAIAQESDTNESEWPVDAKVKSKQQADRKGGPLKKYTRNKRSLLPPVYKAEIRDVNALVDPNLVTIAVKLECDKRWGTYAIGKPLECCDDNGKLISYHVPVAIEVNIFPELITPPPPSEISISDLKKPELWNADEFWTFVVSAKETDYPIPLYYPGLPPYLVTFHEASSIAKQSLGEETIIFSRYYSLGHRGDYYQFDALSGKSIIINCHNLRIEDKDKLLIRAEGAVTKKFTLTAEEKERNEVKRKIYKEQVEKAWGEVKAKCKIMKKK